MEFDATTTLRSSMEFESASPVSAEISSPSSPRKPKCIKSRRTKLVFVFATTTVLAAIAGFLIGYFVPGPLKTTGCCKGCGSKNEEFHNTFQDMVSSQQLEEGLRYFSSKPHLTGSDRQSQLANHIADKWREFGFDEVEIPEYKVLLSLPQRDKPNVVEVVTDSQVQHSIVGKINVSAGTGSKESFQYLPYITYAPAGVVEGELVYCNYGTEEDLAELDRQNISVKGKIVIMRRIYSNVIAVTKRGAIGVLFYPDPKAVAPKGYDDQHTYPNGPWLSKDAVFSKGLNMQFGDPLTPQLPSIPGMYRLPRNKSDLPTMLAQPISYQDALYLLSRLKGNEVPPAWRGDLKITYRFGPGFLNPNTTVRLRVNNERVVKSVYNVIGTIRGLTEPDRYVLLGNHRDAVIFGAADPSSGSATVMEIARVLGKIKEKGWRPRRTVKLCSWGAEEFGLIGSLEWVQQYQKLLTNRAVVYLNTDVAVGGDYVMVAQTCPMLKDAIFCRAKKTKDPTDKGSVYDVMAARLPSPIDNEPRTISYFYFSDYLPFYMSIGIPSADFSYFFGSDNEMRLYPVYHTQQDNFFWIKTFVDPKFQFHRTIATFVGGLLLDFSDSPVLPLDVLRYAKAVQNSFNWLERHSIRVLDVTISTTLVQSAIQRFVNASSKFQAVKDKLTSEESELILRTINDQMIQVEKAFINPLVLGDQESFKHAFARESYHYSFPGVINALKQAKQTGDFGEVKKQLSVVAEAIMSAADIIKPVVCE